MNRTIQFILMITLSMASIGGFVFLEDINTLFSANASIDSDLSYTDFDINYFNDSLEVNFNTNLPVFAYYLLKDPEGQIATALTESPAITHSQLFQIPYNIPHYLKIGIYEPGKDLTLATWIVDWIEVIQPAPFNVQNINIAPDTASVQITAQTNQILDLEQSFAEISSLPKTELILVSSSDQDQKYDYEALFNNLLSNHSYAVQLFFKDKWGRNYSNSFEFETLVVEQTNNTSGNDTNNETNSTITDLIFEKIDLLVTGVDLSVDLRTNLASQINISLYSLTNSSISPISWSSPLNEYYFTHFKTFGSLEEKNTYQIVINAKSEDGLINESTNTFNTNDITPPVLLSNIFNVQYFDISINLEYNEPVILNYQLYEKNNPLNDVVNETIPDYNLNFELMISNLDSGTEYEFIAKATDISGNIHTMDPLSIVTRDFDPSDKLVVTSDRLIVERGDYIIFYPTLETTNWSISYGEGEIRIMNEWFPVNLTFTYEEEINFGIPVSVFPGIYEITFWYEQAPNLASTLEIRVVNPITGDRNVDIRVSGSKTAITGNELLDLSIYATGNLLLGDTNGFDTPTFVEIYYPILNLSTEMFSVSPDSINEISTSFTIQLPENIALNVLDIEIIIIGNSIFKTSKGNYRVQVLSFGEIDIKTPLLLDGPIIEEYNQKIFLVFNTTEASQISIVYGRTYPFTETIQVNVYQSSFKLELIGITEAGSYDFTFEFNDSSGNNFFDNNNGFYYTLQITLQDNQKPLFIGMPAIIQQGNELFVEIYTNEPVTIKIAWGYFFGVYNYYSENLTLDTHHVLGFSNPSPGIEAYWAVWITDSSGNEGDPFESPTPIIFPLPLQTNISSNLIVNVIKYNKRE